MSKRQTLEERAEIHNRALDIVDDAQSLRHASLGLTIAIAAIEIRDAILQGKACGHLNRGVRSAPDIDVAFPVCMDCGELL